MFCNGSAVKWDCKYFASFNSWPFDGKNAVKLKCGDYQPFIQDCFNLVVNIKNIQSWNLLSWKEGEEGEGWGRKTGLSRSFTIVHESNTQIIFREKSNFNKPLIGMFVVWAKVHPQINAKMFYNLIAVKKKKIYP